MSMGKFIEADQPSSGCCGCGRPDCECGNRGGNDDLPQKPDLGMFNYLKDFDKMSDLEKAQLFMPMVEFFYTEHSFKPDAGASVSKGITEITLKTGRVVDDIQFQMSHQGVYTVMVVFKPIDIKMINDIDIINKIMSWGKSTGMTEIANMYGDETRQTKPQIVM